MNSSRVSRDRAIRLLKKALDELHALRSFEDMHSYGPSKDYLKWRRDTEVNIEKIFGDQAACEFANTVSSSDYVATQNGATALLSSMISEVKEWHGDDDTALPVQQDSRKVQQDSRKVFVVHGHDEAAKEKVARFLDKLQLKPIVLSEMASKNRTIIEKFEQHSEACFAVVLLTPDDVGARASDTSIRRRARQNVIFELGYFLCKLGREGVGVLRKGKVEIPSNYAGVEYIPFDDNGGWKLKLAQELKAGGLNVDTNLLSDSS